MNTVLGPVCWGSKKLDLMRMALQHKNLCNCVHLFFGNQVSLNMANLPLIDATNDLPGAAIGTSNASDNAGNGRPVVELDRGSFANMEFDNPDLILTYLHETANALAQHQFTGYTLNSRAFLGPRGPIHRRSNSMIL
jgi:hypothetical protein